MIEGGVERVGGREGGFVGCCFFTYLRVVGEWNIEGVMYGVLGYLGPGLRRSDCGVSVLVGLGAGG